MSYPIPHFADNSFTIETLLDVMKNFRETLPRPIIETPNPVTPNFEFFPMPPEPRQMQPAPVPSFDWHWTPPLLTGSPLIDKVVVN